MNISLKTMAVLIQHGMMIVSHAREYRNNKVVLTQFETMDCRQDMTLFSSNN